ncbi:MAG: PEGA domain-containing protein [Labilithrix sp.]|nr:PEGA domain-containing protein [Labilithrix sp.]MCW5810856.1 PEGA domain-containing protein [Labilithrix sp.]
MRIRLAFSVAAACVVLTLAPAARADAAALKQAGDEAFDARRLDEAARSYEASWSEKHDPSVLYNLARTYEAMGRHADALDRLQRFSDTAPFELRKRVPRLDGMLAVYRTRVATLEIHSNVAGARVIVGSTIVGTTTDEPSTIKVNAGAATIEISKEGFRSWTQEIALEGGRVNEVHATLEPKAEPRRVVVSPRAPSAPAAEAGPVYTRWWFWVGAGAVVAAAGVAVFVALTTERTPADGTLGTIVAPLVTF